MLSDSHIVTVHDKLLLLLYTLRCRKCINTSQHWDRWKSYSNECPHKLFTTSFVIKRQVERESYSQSLCSSSPDRLHQQQPIRSNYLPLLSELIRCQQCMKWGCSEVSFIIKWWLKQCRYDGHISLAIFKNVAMSGISMPCDETQLSRITRKAIRNLIKNIFVCINLMTHKAAIQLARFLIVINRFYWSISPPDAG